MDRTCMHYLLLGAILLWSVFWLAYAILMLNTGKVYTRPRKSFTKKQRPVLFHAELLIAIMWSATGYAALYLYLNSTL